MWLLLGIGVSNADLRAGHDVLSGAGQVDLVDLSERPTRAELNAALDRRSGRLEVAVAVLAADDGLNLAVERLMRRGELADTRLALLPAQPGSLVAGVFGLPAADPAGAAAVAVTGAVNRRGLVRDDHGGVLLGRATLRPWQGSGFGASGHVEDTRVAHGPLRVLTVRPVAPAPATATGAGAGGGGASGAVEISARPLTRLRRTRRARGRAGTVNCEPARLRVDGIDHPRPQRRRTWWHEPDLLQIVLPC